MSAMLRPLGSAAFEHYFDVARGAERPLDESVITDETYDHETWDTRENDDAGTMDPLDHNVGEFASVTFPFDDEGRYGRIRIEFTRYVNGTRRIFQHCGLIIYNARHEAETSLHLTSDDTVLMYDRDENAGQETRQEFRAHFDEALAKWLGKVAE